MNEQDRPPAHPASCADESVRVLVQTVEASAAGPAMSQEEWGRFVRSVAGRVTDPTFERPPQGDHEQRDELP